MVRLALDRESTVAVLAAILLSLAPATGWAGEAEDAALQAYAFQQRYCADVEGATSTTTATEALSEVANVLPRLSRTYDQTGAAFLLLWRGVLLQCVSQFDRAIADLEAFLAEPGVDRAFPSLVKDARRRLKAMARQKPDEPSVRPAPWVAIGIGGGYQLSASPQRPYHYGQVRLDVSVRLYKILRLVVFFRPAFSGLLRSESGVLVEPNLFTTLPSFGLGPELRWEGPVSPSVSVRLQLAPDDGVHAESQLLAGAAVVGGIDIGLGSSPLALRPTFAVGLLGPMFLLTGGVQLVVGL